MEIALVILLGVSIVLLAIVLRSVTQLRDQQLRLSTQFEHHQFEQKFYQLSQEIHQQHHQWREQLHQSSQQLQQLIHQQHRDDMESVLKHLQQGIQDLRAQIQQTLENNTQFVGKQVDSLNQTTQEKLQMISGLVEKRLSEGFEKTNATFTDIMKRLIIIDQAQQRITELSTHVVSLQEVLADKRSRGAFGEVQLSALIRNMLPENHFALQHTLSNNTRVDCLLFLPAPTGNISIDAKFPLDTYRQLTECRNETEHKALAQRFRQDLRKHIQDIASKYILPPETADGAIMFLPAEAIFAEIHAHFPDIVEEAQRAKVWLASPTTMMAILTTVRAVIKDDATRQQIHIIQEHLRKLAKNFELFRSRMNNLSVHIRKAHEDVDQIHTSANKIVTQFAKIEAVDLATEELEEQ
ncbi:MAG: DNA recombination protein RmuC [Legionellales bacterium]|nr:DNA recombination protein RmuC [Legionellales bacterium]